MSKGQFSRVCIINTVYTLLLYLLYSSEEEINKTFFFFGPGIDHLIRKQFAGGYHFFPFPKKSKTKIRTLVYYIFLFSFLWVMRKTQWSFLKKADFFVQDHHPFSGCIIDNNSYTLLHDSPYSFQLFVSQFKKPSKNILIRLLTNKKKQRSFGNNKQCNKIIITDDEILSYMKDKEIITVSLSSLWGKSSITKKQLILDIFNVTDGDIEIIKSRENILFTQCFVDDGDLTKEEHSRIYRKIVDKYDRDTLLVKKHPRETFDYKTLFPDIPVFEKPIPMHLFNLLGVRFKKAITVFSSTVASFDYNIAIDWYGTEISDILLKKRGSKKCPPPFYTKTENNGAVVK
jgi:hypothetical protein